MDAGFKERGVVVEGDHQKGEGVGEGCSCGSFEDVNSVW